MLVLNKSENTFRVYSILKERIAEGSYPPDTWLPTERSLSEEFDVHRSVIRSVLTRLAKDGLIVREQGKRPWVCDPDNGRRPVNTSMRPESSITLAVIMPQHPNYPAASAILQGINEALMPQETEYRMVILNTYGETIDAQAVLEGRALRAMMQDKMSGAICWPTGGERTLPLFNALYDEGVPIIYVDRYPAELSCDFVGIDNFAAANQAMKYLLGLGHRRIAHLTNVEQTTAVLARRNGYVNALLSAGITPSPEWIGAVSDSANPDVAGAVDQFLGAEARPTAIFAMNDALAHLFIIEAESRGIRIPEDISVMGFDNLEQYSPRPALLTTVHQPFDLFGRRAIELLVRRLTEEDGSAATRVHMFLQTEIVERSTCARVG